tara:strand:+ start:9098 stop:9307 length:210 start_codon:yes stop_codon:yes gene_type:complete
MHLRYKGKGYLDCNVCGKQTNQIYGYKPHKAIINLLNESEQKEKDICELCARREIGPKNKAWPDIKRKI